MGKIYSHFTRDERLQLEVLLKAKHSKQEISKIMGRHYSSICREYNRGKYIHRNSDWTEEERYSADLAQQKYDAMLKEKGRDLKVGNDMEFVNYVEDKILNEKRSPQAVLYDIEREGKDFKTKVCLSTLYNYIRSGEVFLNVEMKDCPQPRKKKTKKVGKKEKVQKRASKGTSIEKRPEEVNSRKTVGHWEMDTVVGPQGKSKKCLLVLTERKTRDEIVEPLKDHSAREVVRAMNRIERELGEKGFREKFKSITVDNGSEFADVEGMEHSRRNKNKPRTKIYRCHPYSSYERGSNENQNRLVRRHIPKGVNFDDITRKEVKDLQEWMNDYPRPQFNGMTSAEVYEKALQDEQGRKAA